MTGFQPPDPIRAAFESLARGDLQVAQTRFRDALGADPSRPDALYGMSVIARAKGLEATAIALAGKALRAPGLTDSLRAPLHAVLGQALLAEGHQEAGRAALTVAVTLDPRDVESLTRLGEMALDAEDAPRAAAHFRAAAALLPQEPRALANLGAALFAARAFDEARDVLRAGAKGRETAETLSNLGLAEMALGDLRAARAALARAHELKPEDGTIANNLGTVLMETGEERAAEHLFTEVIGTAPPRPAAPARFNRATILLGEGRYAEGWRDFEARLEVLGVRPALPVWDGGAGDAPVVVTAEQGLGDSVQFLRYLPLATARRPLRLRFPAAPLARLIPGLDPARVLAPEGEAAAEISLMSLPFVLGLDGPPDPAPYLRSSATPEPGLVGLCWSGNPSYRFDRRRSLRPEWLEPLREVPGLRFLALQPGDAPGWTERTRLDTLGDLAEAVGRCALVVSVDTLAAHMAGAVGRPLWLLNRLGGDWRWKGPDWYRDVRQFRPAGFSPPEQSWPPVTARVAAALQETGAA